MDFIAAAAIAFSLFNSPQPAVEKMPDLTYKMVQLTASASLQYEADKPDPMVTRMMDLVLMISSERPRTPFAVGSVVVTELSDSYGTDLLQGSHQAEPGRASSRQELRSRFWATARGDGPQSITIDTIVSQIPRIPERLQSLRARADVVIANTRTIHKLPTQKGSDYTEIVPGVRFLLTEVKPESGYTRVGFEARIARTPGREEMLEPMILGIAAIDQAGHSQMIFDNLPEVETRDEFIIAVKDWGMNSLAFEKVTAFEITVISGLERSAFDVKLGDLPLGSPE